MSDSLPLEKAKEAATKVVAVLQNPENAAKILAARNACVGDIGKFYLTCVPLVTEMCGQVLSEYGFEVSAAGVMKFVGELQKHQEDPELKKYSDELKSQFLPVLSAPAPVPAPAVDEAAD